MSSYNVLPISCSSSPQEQSSPEYGWWIPTERAARFYLRRQAQGNPKSREEIRKDMRVFEVMDAHNYGEHYTASLLGGLTTLSP